MPTTPTGPSTVDIISKTSKASMFMSVLNIFFFKTVNPNDATYTTHYPFDPTIFDLTGADYDAIKDVPRNAVDFATMFQDPLAIITTIKNPAKQNVTVPISQNALLLKALEKFTSPNNPNNGPLANMPNMTVETMYTVMPSNSASGAKIKFLSSSMTVLFFKMSQAGERTTGAITKLQADLISDGITKFLDQTNTADPTPAIFKNVTFTVTYNNVDAVSGNVMPVLF